MHRQLRAALVAGLVAALAAPLPAAPRKKAPRPRAAPAAKKAPVPKKVKRAPRQKPRIRRVRVLRREIFDTRIPSENRRLFRAVNALHVSTKESAIRGQLLLKEGDLYDADLAKESERAIRGILRLRNVKVTPIPVDARTVDLLVSAQETWTTEPVLSFSGVGSELNMKAGLRERNLMGYGKNASYFYRKTDGVISRSYSYDDPRFLGLPLVLNGDYQTLDDGTLRALALTKPFSATVTKLSAGANYLDDTHEVKELDNLGNETDRLRSTTRILGAELGFSAWSTTRRVRRPRLGWRRQMERQTRLSNNRLENDKLYHVFQTGLALQKVNFLTLNHIKQYDRDEDFGMGPSVDIGAGAARRKWVRTSDNANFFTGSANAGFRHGPSQFSLLSTGGSGRFEEGRWRSSTVKVDAEYYNRFQPRQTFACHLGWAAIINPGAGDRINLGGDTGLRGYRLNQFSGNKKVLANVEDRFFVVDDVARFMSLGAVVFADAGYVWSAGRDLRLKDVKADVGAGLRLYLTRTSLGHVLRFDLAYALKRVPNQERTVFTFGSSHAF